MLWDICMYIVYAITETEVWKTKGDLPQQNIWKVLMLKIILFISCDFFSTVVWEGRDDLYEMTTDGGRELSFIFFKSYMCIGSVLSSKSISGWNAYNCKSVLSGTVLSEFCPCGLLSILTQNTKSGAVKKTRKHTTKKEGTPAVFQFASFWWFIAVGMVFFACCLFSWVVLFK